LFSKYKKRFKSHSLISWHGVEGAGPEAAWEAGPEASIAGTSAMNDGASGTFLRCTCISEREKNGKESADADIDAADTEADVREEFANVATDADDTEAESEASSTSIGISAEDTGANASGTLLGCTDISEREDCEDTADADADDTEADVRDEFATVATDADDTEAGSEASSSMAISAEGTGASRDDDASGTLLGCTDILEREDCEDTTDADADDTEADV